MLVNLTPHAINLLQKDGGFLTLEPEFPTPRVDTDEVEHTWTGEYYLASISYGEVTNLPEPREGVEFIVSKMCADAVPERTDLLYPANLLRNRKGEVVGCGALARSSAPASR